MSANIAAPNSCPVETKRLATVTARCALAGITLHHFHGGTKDEVFLVARWSMTREFRSLDDVECWLKTVAPVRAANPAQISRGT